MMSVSGGAVRVVVTGASTLGDGSRPVEIYSASASGGAPVPLTNLNYSVIERYQLTPLEEFRVDGAGQTPVHSFMVKPPNMESGKLYPVLFLIHGGPQGAWGESWS